MFGFLLLAAFLLAGMLVVWPLLPRQSAGLRCYMGFTCGMVLMMTLPSGFAFFFDFTLFSQLCALAASYVIAAICWLCRRKIAFNAESVHDEMSDHPPVLPTLILLISFTVLSGYLLHTHTLRDVGGALHVGQSTYGDLSLHLGIATGLRGASYPPDYTLLPGTLLGYPFFADALVSSMLLFETDLSLAFVVSGTLMMAFVFWGYLIFSWTLTHRVRSMVLSFLLLFVGGGLGFLYMLDGFPGDMSRFYEIFTGFYKTPTNMPDLNLRWVNPLCDLLVPQRTLLAGWMMLMPGLLMLWWAIQTQRRSLFIALGIWLGLMPMVHTHSFLALGLLSFGAGIVATLQAKHSRKGRVFTSFAICALVALCLALPQLGLWTFPQTTGGGSVKFHPNWVNFVVPIGRPVTEGKFIDGYFWFWIKNVGLVYLLLVPAARWARGSKKALAFGALLIYAVAELILFQPNPYDNNKLFYVAFLVMLPLVSDFLSEAYDRLGDLSGKSLVAFVILLTCLLSGLLSIGREVVSDYELFDTDEVIVARAIEQSAPMDAVFVTGQQHCNAVAALTGRRLVCGTPTFLHFHGLDYSKQQAAVKRIYEAPLDSESLLELYDVDYIYVSSFERGDFDIDEISLKQLFPSRNFGDVELYAVSDRARTEFAHFSSGTTEKPSRLKQLFVDIFRHNAVP